MVGPWTAVTVGPLIEATEISVSVYALKHLMLVTGAQRLFGYENWNSEDQVKILALISSQLSALSSRKHADQRSGMSGHSRVKFAAPSLVVGRLVQQDGLIPVGPRGLTDLASSSCTESARRYLLVELNAESVSIGAKDILGIIRQTVHPRSLQSFLLEHLDLRIHQSR
jgi:hypothetical protein